MHESTVRKACKIITLGWLSGGIAFGLMSLAGLGTDSSSPWSPIAVPVFAISSLVFLAYGLLLAMHITALTVVASFAALVVALRMRLRREWSWSTVVLAFVALTGHLVFVVYPRPPGSSWWSGIGF